MRTELVTTLKRQATELISELGRSKEPILITQHLPPSFIPVFARQIEHAAQDERMKLRYHERAQQGACKRSNRQGL